MNKNRLWMIIAGAGAGLLLVVLVVTWRVSAGRAEARSAELVSAAADMVRCVAGDAVELEKAHVHQGFERRMVVDLPDIHTGKPCILALDVVEEKWGAYSSVWFNSAGSKGKDGDAYGKRIGKAIADFRALPLDKSSDQVFLRMEKYGSMLEGGKLAFEIFESARGMYVKDGASEKDVQTAQNNRLRKAPNVPEREPRGRALFTVDGKVAPESWKVISSGEGLVIHAMNEQGAMVVAWSEDGVKPWKEVSGPEGFAGKQALELRILDAPGKERWFLLAHGQKEATETFVGKLTEGGKLAAPWKVTSAPEPWKRAPGGEREAVVLEGGWKAFSVWRLAEKTDEEKKAEKKEREEWDKNFAEQDVQALITLAEQRRVARAAMGIDDDHKRVDGIAYVQEGKEPVVLELEGLGLAGLIAAHEPMVLLGDGGLPAQKLGLATIPAPGEPLGVIAEAGSAKPVEPALRGSPWFRCVSDDGTHWGTTTTGNFLIGMRPASLELVQMTALADEGSHIGCGPAVATVALPFKKDRIYANLLTIRGGELEGAKIHTTAGTNIDEYNRTMSTGAAPGAVLIGWVARGYGLYAVNIKTDHEFGAPRIVAEVGIDGSVISGLHFASLGSRIFVVVARESCEGQACKTTFEALVSEDGAKTWTIAG